MIWQITRRVLGTLHLSFLAAVLAACSSGSGSGGSSDQEEETLDSASGALSAEVCDALAPVSGSGLPLDPVAVAGWPEEGLASLLVARVTSREGDGTETLTLVREFPGRPSSLVVPLHPSGSAEGGAVQVTFGQLAAEGGEFWCQQTHNFQIEPLPAASTARDTAATLQAMEALGESIAARYGWTLQQVRTMDPEALPEHLYPLYFSAHLLGSATDSLAAHLDNLSTEERQLLDRLLTHIDLADHLTASRSELSVLGFIDQSDLSGGVRARSGDVCNASGAARLSTLMTLSNWSQDALSGASGQTMDHMATVAGVVGLIPHPAAQAASAAGGAMLFTVKTMLEGMSNLLPSAFTEVDFQYTHAWFEEDSEEVGEWSDLLVEASSEGWRLDQVILEGLLVGAGTFGGGWSDWMDRVVAPLEGVAAEFAGNLMNMVIMDTTSALVDATGTTDVSLVEVRPRCWSADDLASSMEWAEVEYETSIQEAPDRPHFGYVPAQSGTGGLIVRPAPGRFGGATHNVFKPVEVGEIVVSVSPTLSIVEPGDTIDITVTVQNALDATVEISDGLGFSLIQEVAGSFTFSYTVPARDNLPLRVTAVSISSGGLRGAADAPERSGSTLIQDEDIILVVSPTSGCLEPGESEQFRAIAFLSGDSPPVVWSATGGTISSTGLFTAGNGDAATITATMQGREEVTASARIQILDDCDACRWEASVGGITYGGAQINIMADPHPSAGSFIQLLGPEMQSLDTFVSATIRTTEPLALGATGPTDVFHSTVAPGPLSAWGAPYTLYVDGDVAIEIPMPGFEIIRNQIAEEAAGTRALIEGELQGMMISTELPLPSDGSLPATREAGGSIRFVGTFHVTDTLMICNNSEQ